MPAFTRPRSLPLDLAGMRRRRLVTTCTAAPLAMAAGRARADAQADVAAYPSRLIRIVVPYTPGSIGDLFIRPVAMRLGQSLGQTVIVENKPGASQAIGAADALQSPAGLPGGARPPAGARRTYSGAQAGHLPVHSACRDSYFGRTLISPPRRRGATDSRTGRPA